MGDPPGVPIGQRWQGYTYLYIRKKVTAPRAGLGRRGPVSRRDARARAGGTDGGRILDPQSRERCEILPLPACGPLDQRVKHWPKASA